MSRVPFLGVVAEDFDGVDEGELSLKAGTRCAVVLCEDDGWWTVHTKEKSGIFPGSYVDFVENITLPARVKILQPWSGGPPAGTVIPLLEITSSGWKVKHNGRLMNTTWARIDLTSEPLTPANQPNAANAAPTTPKRTPVNDSVIDFKPLVVEEDIVRLEQLDPLTTPSKVLLQSPSRPLPTQPTSAGNAPPTTPTRAGQAAPSSPVPKQARVSIAAPKEPARAGMKPSQASRASSANNRNLRETILNSANMHDDEALSKEMKRIRESTYRRPVSIFGKFSVNADYDVVFENDQKQDPYAMPPKDRPKYEQDGRWEFRAMEDNPPCPAFTNCEKKYVTAQPSWIDFKAKERSAVFDI